MRFVLKMVVGALALIGIAYVSDDTLLVVAGDTITDQLVPALFAAVILGIAGATIGAIAKFIINLFTLPLGCLTLQKGQFAGVVEGPDVIAQTGAKARAQVRQRQG